MTVLAAFTVPVVDFEIPMEIVVLGLITGLAYGLLAVGLTLVYRTTRVLNFAQGALGALPATLLPVLVVSLGLTYWVAMPVALAVGAGMGCLLEVLVIRRLQHASRLVVMVATIASAQVLGVLVLVMPRTDGLLGQPFPTPFTVDWSIGTLRLGAGEVLIVLVAPAMAVGLSIFLRRTRLGLAAAAAAENAQAALMTGIPVKRVSLMVWGLAGLFAAAAAVLEAGSRPIGVVGAGLGPALLVRGLAAAMVGGFKHLPRVFAAGVGIGVVEQLVRWNHPTGGVLNLVLFGLILLSMLVHRELGLAARGDPGSAWALAAELAPLPGRLARHPRVVAARRGGLVALVLVTALLPAVLGASQTVLLSSVLLWALMGLSLVVLTGFAGQVSLGHYAFVMLGALVGGRTAQLGFPAGSAILYVVAASAAVAVVVGLPALRVRGLFLAVVTLAFAIAAEGWLFEQSWLVRSSFQSDSSMIIERPRWFGVDFSRERNYTWLCLGALTLAALGVHRLRHTGVGRAMVAVRDNELSAASMSVSPRRTKIQAFVLSGIIAGIAGYLYGGLLVNFTAALQGIDRSLGLLVMVILGGVTTVTGALLGALWVQGIPYAFGTNIGMFTSAFGVLIVLLALPSGLAGLAFRVRDRAVTALTGEPTSQLQERTDDLPRRTLPARARPTEVDDATSDTQVPALSCDDVVVRFGGNVAVDGVSVHAAPGEVVGLLGPNGAGKTTLFDVLSGHQRPTSGTVALGSLDVTGLPPEQRAQLGLGRTFQQARLFDGLTVLESVQVALERTEPSEVVPSVLGLPPSRRAERRTRDRAGEVLELLGLAPYASRRAGELSTGMRRMAELACVVALGAEVILLDEPTAGIAQAEVERFTPVLAQIRDHLDATVVVIEHDIPLLMALVDRMYVLSSGTLIAEGPPEVVRADPAVVEAYLGADDRAVTRSGAQSSTARPTVQRRRHPPLESMRSEQ
jgi:ABC-type branched-subunit amino acid transport system ATPase component/ABC-type branched-subunit amino acid transport system permease subunit